VSEQPTLESPVDAGHAALARVRALLRELDGAARELPGDVPEVPLAEDPEFRRQISELEIDVCGIEALLARGGGLRRDVAVCRLATLEPALLALARSALGYYALPDPLPIDNESPIGHHRSRALTRALLEPAGTIGGAPGAHAIRLRNRLAGWLLGGSQAGDVGSER